MTAAESIISPVPPDALLAPMAVATPERAWRLAALTTLFSVLGGVAGYLIGVFFMDYIGWALVDFYGLRRHFASFENMYQSYGIAVVLIGAFTPIPYKVIAITSGIASLNPFIFILFSVIGRGTRFFIVAAVCRFWGPAAEELFLRLAFGASSDRNTGKGILRQRILLILAGSSFVLLGAYYFEYIAGLAPCELCEWQRWPYYAVIALTSLALFVPVERLLLSVVAASSLIFVASAGLAAYHAGVEWAFWPSLGRCGVAADIARDPQGLLSQLKTPPPPPLGCDEAAWRLWGLSLAGYNFLISLALAGFALWTFWTFWEKRFYDEKK